jgi:hypothetical protein
MITPVVGRATMKKYNARCEALAAKFSSECSRPGVPGRCPGRLDRNAKARRGMVRPATSKPVLLWMLQGRGGVLKGAASCQLFGQMGNVRVREESIQQVVESLSKLK